MQWIISKLTVNLNINDTKASQWQRDNRCQRPGQRAMVDSDALGDEADIRSSAQCQQPIRARSLLR
jgi:hypothetical protein